MGAVEIAKEVRVARRGERFVEVSDFGEIEIEIADCGENRERRIFRGWSCSVRETGAVEIDACGAFADLSDAARHASATGKSCEIDAVIVDREHCVRVVGDRLRRFDFGRPRAVAGVIGGGDDVAVFFGTGLKCVDGTIAASGGIEGVDDRPTFLWRVGGGEVEGVGLIGLGGAGAVEVDLAGDGGRGFLLGGGERTEDEKDRECATHCGEYSWEEEGEVRRQRRNEVKAKAVRRIDRRGVPPLPKPTHSHEVNAKKSVGLLRSE